MELQGALDGARYRLVGALKGRPLFHQGEAAEAIYRVQRGCVRLEIEGEEGQRDVVTFLFAGDTVCAGFDTHWASAHAVSDSVLAVYAMQTVWEHLAHDPEAAHRLLVSADDRLDHVAHHLALVGHATAEARLRWFLGWVAPRTVLHDSAGSFQLPMNRRDIADFLGLAPETVSRSLRELENSGELRRLGDHRCVFRPHAGRSAIETRGAEAHAAT
jgi:CRP-like cAMP-binding protein